MWQNINKQILYNLLERKIKDKKLQWLTKEILYSNGFEKGLPIRKLYKPVFCKYIFERNGSICKKRAKDKILV